ncbi:hypothetical protein [Akkermansia muciniphila]|uniref:hypothetical protein n=1 Tax=Akkermansia muciniphila TaxID=239935 RepID=UPI000FE2E847|nr:hypothetical protein [Akkermansia muciniphila]
MNKLQRCPNDKVNADVPNGFQKVPGRPKNSLYLPGILKPQVKDRVPFFRAVPLGEAASSSQSGIWTNKSAFFLPGEKTGGASNTAARFSVRIP